MLKILNIILLSALLVGCSSLEQTNYYTDDLYYDYEHTHNFNTSAILNNENVAMPEEAVVYYDEAESNRLNPSFEDRLNALETESATETISEDINSNNWSQPRSPHYPMVGLGLSTYNSYFMGGMNANPGFISPYNTFNPYYHPYGYPVYGGGQVINQGAGTTFIPTRTNNPTIRETQPYRPNISTSRYEAERQNRLSQPIRPVQSNGSGVNRPDKSGYNSNSSREYRKGSGNSRGVWSNPGYHNNSRSNSSVRSGSSKSSGTIQGVRRR